MFKMIKQTADTQIFLDMGLFKYDKTYAIDLGINGGEKLEPDQLPRFTFEKYCSEPVNTEDNGETRLWFKSCVNGTHCIIDPTDSATTSSVEIYEVEDGENPGCETVYMDKLKWVKIHNMPFDTCFFKVGHPYIIRKEIRDGGYFIGMLKSMTHSEMTFISFEWDDVRHEYVEKEYIHTADAYNRHKKSKWYKPLLPTDHWKDTTMDMLGYPIIAVQKYIKKRLSEVSELQRDMLYEINGVINSEFNAAYGGICGDPLSINEHDDRGDN